MGTATNTKKPEHPGNPWLRTVGLALLYIAVWVALWRLSTVFDPQDGSSLWYPTAGLTFALLLEYGARALPLPIAASLLIASWSVWSWEQWPYLLLAHLLSPLGYAVAAQALRRELAGQRPKKWSFNDPQRVATFLGAAAGAALFAALMEVLLAAGAGALSGSASLREFVLGRWIGDFLGVTTLAPLALIFAAPLVRRFRLRKPLRGPAAPTATPPAPVRLTIFQITLSFLLMVLFWVSHQVWSGPAQPFMSLLLLPVLAWIAATHSLRSTVLVILFLELGIVAILSETGQAEQVLKYQVVMMAIVTAGLLTGAASQARLAEITRFRNLAEVSNDLLWEFDNHGHLRDLSGRFAKTIKSDEGQRRDQWRDIVIPQQQDTDFLALESAIQRRQPFQQKVLRIRLPDQEHSLWTLNSGLPLFDEEGEFLGYRGATTDITDYKKAEALRQQAEALLRDYDQKLEAKVAERTQTLAEASQRNWRMANFDNLTSLPNRNLFFEHLRKGLKQARRQWRLAAVLLVDLDGFKQVNDTFGHDAGDELLRQIANRLQQCVRATDTVARFGGDEFTIMLLNLEQPQGAEAVARKIVEHLAEPVPLGEASATVTASVGIALYRPEWPDTLDLAMTLLRQADAAMYAAKNAGKNAWRVAEQLGLD
ncbi:MAG: diguanylate cyclase [Candidatus Competibacteraceae bacterium]